MNYLTINELKKVIDNHIEVGRYCTFIVTPPLAYLICEYLETEYDLFDEDPGIFTDVKEFYLSLCFDGNEVEFFCEDAKGLSGEYKLCDMNDCDYFIESGIKMNSKQMNDKLQGERCTWSRFELVEEIVSECDGCCDCCEFGDEEEIDVEDLLEVYVERLQDVGNCKTCLSQILEDFMHDIFKIMD